MTRRVRMPLPVGYTRCQGIDCDRKADCGRHATIAHEPAIHADDLLICAI